MRAAMCFSHFQLPRCQIRTSFSGCWWKKVHDFSTRVENNSNFRLLGPNINCGLQGGHNRQWTRKSLSTNTQGKNMLNRKTNNIVTSLTPSNLNTSTVELSESKSVHIEQKIEEYKDVVIICFDTETTGFNRERDRMIEVAFRDLSGGENSTLQTLINPEKFVTNSEFHGISGYMVNSPGVPRMKDLIPILLQWVESRRKPGGQVLLIAHNCRTFDVPFLKNEFHRCGYKLPPYWRFCDTMPLANKVIKTEGSTLTKKSLGALREYYDIPLNGKAHRAMADVNVLASVLQKMTHELKLTVSNLVENYTFTASEIIINSEKKKVQEKK